MAPSLRLVRHGARCMVQGLRAGVRTGRAKGPEALNFKNHSDPFDLLRVTLAPQCGQGSRRQAA
jgi:hypothetical protein